MSAWADRRPPLIIPTDGSAAWRLPREDDCTRLHVAVGPRGRWVAGSSGGCRNVRLWDLETRASHVLDVGKRIGSIGLIQFTPDGHLLALADDLKRLFLFNVEKGTYELLLEDVWYFELSGDGGTIAYISDKERGHVFVYEMETGFHRNFPAYEGVPGEGALRTIAIDSTGELVATGDGTGLLRVGPVTEEVPHLLLGHQGPVWWLAFSPEGKWIASSAHDQTVRLWPIPEGRPLHTLPYEELLEKLRSLTNMRIVPDEEYSTGYRIDYEPFPGFAKVPVW